MRPAPAAIALLVATPVLRPAPASAQSAYQQLEEACRQGGGNCNPDVPSVSPPSPVPTRTPTGGGGGVQQGEAIEGTRPSQSTGHRSVSSPQRAAPPPRPPKKSTNQVVLEQFTLGLVQGLLSSLLAPAPAPDAPRGPSPEELAEQERRRVAELQARAALVAEQRTARDAQQASNMDSMAAAMGVGFDVPVGVADGGSGDVALAGTTPSLFAPPVYRSPDAAPPSPAVQRLSALAAQNEDVAELRAHFAELSVELDAALREADAIGRASRNRVEEYEQMERTVAKGVADAWDRGMSMAVDGLLLGHSRAIARVEEVRSNARAWNELKSMLHEAQRGAAFIDDANEKLEALDQLRSDAAFATRQRHFKEDVAYLADRFGGPYVEYGKSILSSARSVRDYLQIMHRQGQLEGFDARYHEQRLQLQRRLAELHADVKRTRSGLSARTGIAEKDLALPAVPPPPGSFGTKPPPVPVK